MLQTVTIAWKYINKYTQFPCYRFLPLSNWSFFSSPKIYQKGERHFFIFLWNKCIERYMFLLLFPVFPSIIWPPHLLVTHSSQNRSIFGSSRLVVFASLLHYITVLLYLKCITRCIFSCIIILRWRIWSLIQGWPKGLFPFISVANISRISGVVAKD